MNEQPALETRALCKSFGALTIARDIDFRLPVGARHALIGPNGAGKTTFIDLVTGRLKPSSGQILLAGTDVTALPAEKRVKGGIGRTFQINTLFNGLGVLENVLLAVGERRGVAGNMLRRARTYRAVVDESRALLERLGLGADGRAPSASCPMAVSASSKSLSPSPSIPRCCCLTSRRRAYPRRKAASSSTSSRLCRGTSRC